MKWADLERLPKGAKLEWTLGPGDVVEVTLIGLDVPNRAAQVVEKISGAEYLVGEGRLSLPGGEVASPAEPVEHPPCTCDLWRGCTCGAMERERGRAAGA